MTSAEKRAKNRDRNKEQWTVFYNPYKLGNYSSKDSLLYCFRALSRHDVIIYCNKVCRNSNKRLITYLNRTARAEHMKQHGKTPKPVKTIRQMYLDEKI